MRRTTVGASLALLCMLLAQQARAAAYGDDLGFISLSNELGGSPPNGSGVSVTQVEAPETNGGNNYFPDTTNSEFSGKTITPRSTIPQNTPNSGHATTVGTYFYGNSTSMSPGIGTINVYNANNWIQSGFLNGTNSSLLPGRTTDRVANHSWIGFFDTNTVNILHHFDYLVQHDDYINVVGVNNPNNGGIAPLLSSSFNAISVGLSNGTAASGTGTLDGLYVSGRAEPDIVVPQNLTSFATPTVSSAAALLVQYAHNTASISNGTVSSTRKNITLNLEYAETNDVIKAALMAGAVRRDLTKTASQQTSDYTPGAGGVQNGLDSRYGAGQLNIDNSYHILAGAQQAANPTVAIGTFGFDYNPTAATNLTADYTFTGHTAVATSLVWNAHVDDNLNATLAHYTLTLYLVNSNNTKTTVATSASTIDNTQNIFAPSLNPAANYELEVNRTDAISSTWDYGLAWNLASVPEPGSLAVTFVAVLGLFRRRPRRCRPS